MSFNIRFFMLAMVFTIGSLAQPPSPPPRPGRLTRLRELKGLTSDAASAADAAGQKHAIIEIQDKITQWEQDEMNASRSKSGTRIPSKPPSVASPLDPFRSVEINASKVTTASGLTAYDAPTVFGSFLTEYATDMEPNSANEVKVVFRAVTLSEATTPTNICIRVLRLSRDVNEVKFIPEQQTSRNGQHPFKAGDLECIASGDTITWTWTLQTPKEFRQTGFTISFQAQDNNTNANRQAVVANLPIRVSAKPRPSWFERHETLIAGSIQTLGVLFAALLGWKQNVRSKQSERLQTASVAYRGVQPLSLLPIILVLTLTFLLNFAFQRYVGATGMGWLGLQFFSAILVTIIGLVAIGALSNRVRLEQLKNAELASDMTRSNAIAAAVHDLRLETVKATALHSHIGIDNSFLLAAHQLANARGLCEFTAALCTLDNIANASTAHKKDVLSVLCVFLKGDAVRTKFGYCPLHSARQGAMGVIRNHLGLNPVDLAGANLRDLDLSNLTAREVNLTFADLRGVNLERARLA